MVLEMTMVSVIVVQVMRIVMMIPNEIGTLNEFSCIHDETQSCASIHSYVVMDRVVT